MRRPDICRTHVCHKSEAVAAVAASEHLNWLCPKCRMGMLFHVWRCEHGRHFHAGHAWPRVLEREAAAG